MVNTFSLYALTLMLSFSILGPSVFALLENDIEIEISKDIEEEKDAKKELEEYENFLYDLPSFTTDIIEENPTFTSYYLIIPYGHIKDISLPPPDYI